MRRMQGWVQVLKVSCVLAVEQAGASVPGKSHKDLLSRCRINKIANQFHWCPGFVETSCKGLTCAILG